MQNVLNRNLYSCYLFIK